MLKIKGTINPVHEIITVDFYVPIDIRFERREEKNQQYLYWRTGKFLEIGINPESYSISSITMVSASNVFEADTIVKNEKKLPIFGLPVIETNLWDDKKNYVDASDNKDFEVYLSCNKIIISLYQQSDPYLIVKNGRVTFGLGVENTLAFIEISDLNTLEITTLKEALLTDK